MLYLRIALTLHHFKRSMKVEITNLSKYYGSQAAVDNLNFTVDKGEILGFLGPNGAGKSTTMKMITGYINPSQGHITLDGKLVSEDPEFIKSHIGYLSEANPLYKDMYVREYLAFVAQLHKLSNTKSKVDDVIQMTGLGKEAHKQISQLSKGYKQRVGIAQALIHDPAVLILDEPTSGLDLNQLVDIRNLVKSLQPNKTILFSTHIMQEVQALCSRVIIINEGKIVADDTIEALGAKASGQGLLRIEVLHKNIQLEAFKQVKGITNVKKEGEHILLNHKGGLDIRPDVFELCVKNNWVLIGIQKEEIDVEKVFQNLTKNEN